VGAPLHTTWLATAFTSGVGLTITVAVIGAPLHEPDVGVMVNVTVTGTLVGLVNVPLILPEPLLAIPVTTGLSLTQLNTVPGTLPVNAIFVIAAPEHIVCAGGVAVAFGVGLTVMVNVFDAPVHTGSAVTKLPHEEELTPVGMVATIALVAVLITSILLAVPLLTYNLLPSALNDVPIGFDKAGSMIVVVTRSVAVLTTDMVPEVAFGTYRVLPSGLTDKPAGRLPTPIVERMVFVAALITVTVAVFLLATYTLLPLGVMAIPRDNGTMEIGDPTNVFVLVLITDTSFVPVLPT
jgi:hypothetical protein